MESNIVVYEAKQAIVESKRGNYAITSPMTGLSDVLRRDEDFGVIPGTKQPSLFKSGAEKVCMAYGLMQRFSIESKQESFGDDPFFYFLVRCDLVKVAQDGKEYVFTSSFGSANTKERRNGFNKAFDAANSTLKMAQKRALVGAAISVSGLSGMFTQDMENESFVENGYKKLAETQKDDAPITKAQAKRLYAIGESNGLKADEVKNIMAANGFARIGDITQKDYDRVCGLLAQKE